MKKPKSAKHLPKGLDWKARKYEGPKRLPPNRARVAAFHEHRRKRPIIRKFKTDAGEVKFRIVRVVFKHAAQ